MFPTDGINACRQPANELLRDLGTSREGLTAEEAEARLQQYGPNQLETQTRIHPFKIFIDQFKSFIIYILLFAVFFSLLVGEYVDSMIILLILMMNAIIGFCQELSAHKSLEALKKLSSIEAMVLRDGARRTVDASLLVPGDIILLEAGGKVPADARIIEAVHLKVEESALTGESVPVEKHTAPVEQNAVPGDRSCMVFSGTLITAGRAVGVVTGTGEATQIGRISTSG